MAINALVIVREVLDTRDLTGQVLDDSGALRPLSTRFEPEDLNALEMALRIKDDQGGTVTALSIGQPGDVDVLRECLYRGCDKVVRIDADSSAIDTRVAAKLLAAAIQQQEGWDLVITGVNLVERETSLLGSEIAGILGVEQASYLDGIESVADGKVVSKRAIEMGYEYVESPLPAVVTVGVALVEDDPRTPRSAKAMLKLKAKKVEIPVLTPADLGVDTTPAVTLAGYEAVPERVIESRDVDADDETALKAMLDEVLKGE